MDIEKLVRKNIQALQPYRSARDDFDSGILLDANENSFGDPFGNEDELNRYPMPYQEVLRSRIADFRKVNVSNVFVGVGSDEAIDLLIRIFCEPGQDRILVTPPTYGMYKVSAQVNDVAIDMVMLTPEFELVTEEVLAGVTSQTKIIFLCSPNNPTANVLKRESITKVIEGFDGIVVVDEAYIDFSGQPGFSEQVNSYENLVVLQTMSKSFGLAGIRLGVALGNPKVIDYMMKVKAPYNVNKLTSQYAIAAFDKLEDIKKRVQSILDERKRMEDSLLKVEAVERVYKSDANFLLFRIENALEVYNKCAEKGVVVRYRGNEPHCENCLRLTIGTPEENNRFLQALKEIVKN